VLYQVTTYAAHDLPVTGMGFAPPILAHNLGKQQPDVTLRRLYYTDYTNLHLQA
jgi:hypothetical protein